MELLYLPILVKLFVWSSSIFVNADPLTITLPNGQIRGHQLTSPNNVTFYGFQGIPYGKAPIGELRFQAPQPAENWEGVLDATKDGSSCYSYGDTTVDSGNNGNTSSEDCLVINVYTPKLRTNNDSELLPVMFWIYGGAFAAGSAAYNKDAPDYFLEQDVVFVSINYRVGAFGFLSTGDTVIPGNAGLKDQTLALKWTKQNIALFGGDPEKVTIFGESAGSMSVTYHLVSTQSAGLFRGAICDSGTALSYASVNHEPMGFVLSLISAVATSQNLTIDQSNLTTENIRDILVAQPAEVIMEAVSSLSLELSKPTIEAPHDGAFLSESPYVLLENGSFIQVPLLMGFNSEEYLTFVSSVASLQETGETYDTNSTALLPTDFFLKNGTNVTEVTALIKDIFLEKDQLFEDNLGEIVQLGSENMMARPIIKHAELQSKFTDVFVYQFSYYGILGGNRSFDGITGSLLGYVGHGDELKYLFKMFNSDGTAIDLSDYPEQDVTVHNRAVKMWTNFVKTLNPTPEKSELLQNVTWPTVQQSGFKYLDIGPNLTVVNAYPRKDHYEKWNNLFNSYGRQPFYNF